MSDIIKCPECGGENIIEGRLNSHFPVVFIKKGTENKLRPESYKVESKACTDCGKMFDLRIVLKNKDKE